MSAARHAVGRRGAWLRVLVLLLVLVVPCAHATARTALPAPTAGVSGGAGGEYDHLDTVARTPVRGAHRAVGPQGAAAAPVTGPRAPVLVPAVASGPPPSRRSVVLRC
ncbi:hypothetical protein [Streptomyces rochei]|uniref:hypothetical protein n=1 Tax=Streptomyces rochei TaxID=1928 RepID=UPI002949AC1A|nr:hypothetical protein [Streptomyces sp. UP1A-1]